MLTTSPVPTPKFPSSIIPDGPDFEPIIQKSMLDTPGPTAGSFLRFYSKAMQSWLYSVVGVGGPKVPVLEATTKVAFGEYNRLLQRYYKEHDPEKLNLLDTHKPPLPFISFSRKSFKPILGRLNGNVPLRNLRLINSETDPTEGGLKRTVTWSRPPLIHEIAYQVDIWSDYRHVQAHIMQQVATQFWNGSIAYWCVESPFSNRMMPIRLTGGFDDSTDTNPAGETVYRNTFQVIVEGAMFFDEMASKTIMTETNSFAEEVSGQTFFERSEKLTSLAPLTAAELALIETEDPVSSR